MVESEQRSHEDASSGSLGQPYRRSALLTWRYTALAKTKDRRTFFPTHIIVSEEQEEDNDDGFTMGQLAAELGTTKAPWVDAGHRHPVSTTVAP